MIKSLIFSILLAACGSNIFKSVDKSDPGEDATVAMENGNPQKAISILEKAIEDEPENYRYYALLAAAMAQKYGVSVIQIALKMGESDEEEEGASDDQAIVQEEEEEDGDSSSSDVTKLFPVLPVPSDENIDGIKEAIETLGLIPSEELREADVFLLSLLNTAILALRTKTLDTDGDGQLSPVELLDLNEDTAVLILEDLISASEALAAGGGSGGSEVAREKLEAIQEAIASQEGETDAERLRNFFNGKQ
ncbi:MAG: hypothetical protein AB7T49_15760 [Oligoflexales bacterium]